MENLTELFINPSTRKHNVHVFEHMKQKEDESVQDYALRLETQQRLAYPDANAGARDEVLLRQFERGCRYRKQLALMEPATYQAAIQCAT